MTKTLHYTDRTQYWSLKERLKERGYKLISDCHWYQIFEKGNRTIILENNCKRSWCCD